MSSEIECLFRQEISFKSLEYDKIAKYVTVNREGREGIPFLQVWIHLRASYAPTAEGVRLSTYQTRMLMELAENFFIMQEPNTWDEHLSPEGIHDLMGGVYIGVVKGGKEVVLMKKKNGGMKGITLITDEYRRLIRCFGPIRHIMFPTPSPKDVEIVEPVAFHIRQVLNSMRSEKCTGCQMELGNQLGHECVTMDEESFAYGYYEEATTRVNMSHLLRHVEYLHGLLKCENPLPTVDAVKEYFKYLDWFIPFTQKTSDFEPLLASFDELYPILK